MKHSTLTHIYFSLGILAGILFQSCSNSTDPAVSYTLAINMDTNRFNSNATKGTLTITTDGNWTIKDPDSANWLSLSQTEGKGNATVTIDISKNNIDNERFAHLIVSVGDIQKHIYFQQAPATYSGPTNTAGYFEIPKDTTIPNCIKITRSLPGSRATMRNYTMFYDTDMKLAYWVAYPLTSSYLGSSGRSEAWDYDPLIQSGYQPQLYSAYSGGYSRGHQIPSADRTYNNLENSTTFFFSNMTAQNYDLNAGIWADLEAKVRTWMKNGPDTMYVVTGSMIRTKTNQTITYASDNNGAKIAVPKYYYKALAQKRGNSYYTIAFKMDNAEPPTSPTLKNYQLSVSDLEKETGYTFFPALSASIKSQINTAIWSY